MITELINRLTAANTDYETIQCAWAQTELVNINAAVPILYLMQGNASSSRSGSMPVRQESIDTIVTLTICKWTDLQTLREQLYGALLGYQHTQHYDSLEHQGGEVLAINGELIQWRDTFATWHTIKPA